MTSSQWWGTKDPWQKLLAVFLLIVLMVCGLLLKQGMINKDMMYSLVLVLASIELASMAYSGRKIDRFVTIIFLVMAVVAIIVAIFA